MRAGVRLKSRPIREVGGSNSGRLSLQIAIASVHIFEADLTGSPTHPSGAFLGPCIESSRYLRGGIGSMFHANDVDSGINE
jgi:hypothetical protein